MPKYYSLCDASPSVNTYANKYKRVFDRAPQGYLFHDTEGLHVSALRKPLFILSELYPPEAKAVVYVRVNAETIMATFSTAGVPVPTATVSDPYRDKLGYEYLGKHRPTGWLQKNVRDPAEEIAAVNYDDIYDTCTMLERFTGKCPCPKLAEGTCWPITLYKQYPWLSETLSNFTAQEPSVYKRKRFEAIDGFKYTPGSYTTKHDFEESVRPWDSYDFSIVDERIKAFAERGEENARRTAHRKIACSQCAFSIKKHTGNYADCGSIAECREHITEEEAWTALYDWLNLTPFVKGFPGFSLPEIHYLMAMAGSEYLSRAITPTRDTLTKLAGFRLYAGSPEFIYRVVPCKGNKQRRTKVESYAALREYFPILPKSEDIPKTELLPKQVLAHAIFSTWACIRASGGHQPHPLYSIISQHTHTTLIGATTRGTFEAHTLSNVSDVSTYVHYLWPNGYPRIKVLSKRGYPGANYTY
jgi:hypothetical protein